MSPKTSKRSQSKTDFNISQRALKISDSLGEIIHGRIKENNGEISFSEFMQVALYEPQLGYYQNNLEKFGSQGDFVTAPEISKFFAGCLAQSLTEILTDGLKYSESTGKESTTEQSIMEIGAGSGRLAVDLLTALAASSRLPANYYILEPSATLQSQQSELLAKELPEYFEKIQWLVELPQSFEGVIIANEVIDALPFDRIIKQTESWYRLNVSYSNDRFSEILGHPLPESMLPKYLSDNENYPVGYKTEIRPIAKGWISALASCLSSGAIILADYGYPEHELYHAQRAAGSLKCFINHHQHDDPFQHIGLQDITAHVDFTDIAYSAYENGMEISGFTTQAGFLLENGITESAGSHEQHKSKQQSQKQTYEVSRELQQLLMPGQMGEVIKVMLLTKNTNHSIKGFSLQDHLRRL